jgi:phage-related minor tail protein
MTVDERIEALVQRHEALTMNLELLTHDVRDLKTAAQQDGENIRALARIAEIHHERITRLEDHGG